MRNSFSVLVMIRYDRCLFKSSLHFDKPHPQTDEDMFRSLCLFKSGAKKAAMKPPLSVTLIEKGGPEMQDVDLAIAPEAVFTTAVGHTGKRTLASWHVTTPAEVIEHMLQLVNGKDPKSSL